jgi:predicted Zn-dependent protease
MFRRGIMIDMILEEGEKSGFAVTEVFRQKIDKKEHERFEDYRAAHSVSTDRLTVRAFWDVGDPVGFSLSSPDMKSIKSSFANVCSAQLPDKRENYGHLLPESVQKKKVNIYDESIDLEDDKRFEELVEQLNEILVSFPGLTLKRIYLSQNVEKVYIANSRRLNAKYRKTDFNLLLKFVLKDNIIEINESTTFFKNFDPYRIVPRAFNLLNSLTDNRKIDRKTDFFVFSPEASAFMLKEFSEYFKLDAQRPVKKIHLSPILNIVDDPLMDDQAGSVPFDDEGVQVGETSLISKGIFSGRISDIRSAFSLKAASSGNGFRRGRSIFPEVRFSNLCIKPSVLSLKKILRDAGSGILVSLIKLKYNEKDRYIFSAYGFTFKNGEIKEPVHFYFSTTFLSYFVNIIKVTREMKYFYGNFNIGTPYILLETKWKSKGMFEI